jgi:hypothetical protein
MFFHQKLKRIKSKTNKHHYAARFHEQTCLCEHILNMAICCFTQTRYKDVKNAITVTPKLPPNLLYDFIRKPPLVHEVSKAACCCRRLRRAAI